MKTAIINDKGEYLTDILLAYIAGFVDAEGCIMAARNNYNDHRYHIVCSVAQKTPEVLELIKSYFGGSLSWGKASMCYYLRLSALSADKFIRAIEPYLILKKEQAQVAIEFHERQINKNRSSCKGISDDDRLYERNAVRLLKDLKKHQMSQCLLGKRHDKEEVVMSYVAGLFDGDGCISITKRSVNQKRVKHELVCQVNQYMKLVTDYLLSIFGGRVAFSERVRKSGYTSYLHHWIVAGKSAMEFLGKIQHYLIIKKSQAELAIEFQGNRQQINVYRFSEQQVAGRESQRQLMHDLKYNNNQAEMAL